MSHHTPSRTLLGAAVLLSLASPTLALDATLVKDILPGSETSFAENFVTFNGAAYFRATDGVNGFELWRSDGTASGTHMVADLNAGSANGFPINLAAANGKLFFSAFNDSPATGQQVYVSDGTTAGTQLVADLAPGAPAGGMFGPPAPGGFTPLDSNTVLFTATNPATGQELYRTDGTPAGTSLVKDIHPGPIDSIPAPLTTLNGITYFVADDSFVTDPDTGFSVFDRELWRSDGTAAGTYRVKDINPGPATSMAYGLEIYQNNIYFTAVDETNVQRLYKTDGTTAGTVPISSHFTDAITVANNKIMVTMDDGSSGLELYVSDGTPAGTSLLKDIRPGADSASPFYMTAFNGKTYFAADDGTHGSELWVTDGTTAGTEMFIDLSGAERSSPRSLTVVGDKLFFVTIVPDDANFTVQTQLWMTDGTEAGTELVYQEPGDSFGYAIDHLIVLGNMLLFTAPTGLDGDGYSIDPELFRVVVPEPSSLATLAAPAMLLRRRR